MRSAVSSSLHITSGWVVVWPSKAITRRNGPSWLRVAISDAEQVSKATETVLVTLRRGMRQLKWRRISLLLRVQYVSMVD